MKANIRGERERDACTCPRKTTYSCDAACCNPKKKKKKKKTRQADERDYRSTGIVIFNES